MRLRTLLALAVVLALVLGSGLLAAAEGEANCWYVSYTVEMRGKKVLRVPNTCIPCLALCDYLPPPPGAGHRAGTLGISR